MNESDRIGLIAGWGDFPISVAQSLRDAGKQVICLGIRGHADRRLKSICHRYRETGLARLGQQRRIFRRWGVHRATMAGKIFKTLMFRRFSWIRHAPDLTTFRKLAPHFITRTKDRRDDSLLLTAVETFAEYDIELVPATDFAPELLVKPGFLTRRQPSAAQMSDIEFGWEVAKEMGRLDIGQSIAVKGQAILAVEAVEGTDECIRRAGDLCPVGGFTVVKVTKPQQDMRFDVPTVGLGTLQTIQAAGGGVLAVEADRTIILNEREVLRYADQHKLCIVSIENAQAGRKMLSA